MATQIWANFARFVSLTSAIPVNARWSPFTTGAEASIAISLPYLTRARQASNKGPAGVEGFDYAGGPLRNDDVKDIVKDIRGDGHLELAVRSFDMTEGENEWPSVYAWTGNGYTNVSSQYPSYYRTWLASLKKEIAKLETERERVAQARSTPPAVNGMVIEGSGVVMEHRVLPAEPETAPSVSPEFEAGSRHDIDDKQAQAAKIERFLGSKDAGMLDAMRWANSDDPGERDLATSVFVDMGTPEALRYEQTLSRDAAPKVAKRAQHDLKSWWGKVEAYYAPTFDHKLPDYPGDFCSDWGGAALEASNPEASGS